ncbi:NAD-dependent aldehyde dehydrogenase domain-containing protein [Metamycoplasma cloacale]|uniref:Aldehyde dehydrogenase n=1 Tax=Metamycoplasma cloacale TaxID=92401 RepID=A0A2Z4LMJ7_9BACT|nr:aldehyde dehydrogenase family protein [Metamycoplasma cloacale]AWX42884.1 aldehyde dehydrogenase [Metamycoplasma cloacale]VEU79292.1 NAD-dependent aldehyde dehydrogenase domain-containing protein [Metamycoplasma cloacale]
MITIDVKERLIYLKKLKLIILKHEKEIIDALYRDLNKNELESQITEIRVVFKELNLYIKKLKKWSKDKRVTSPKELFYLKSYLKPTAYGKTLIISPWNYPFNLTLIPLINAFGAGNTVVLKPSEFSKHTSIVLEKIINETFNHKYVNIHLGGKEVAQSLLNEDLDFIFFTGNTAVGQIIYKKAAEKMIPCVLELGGKSPVIIDPKIKNLENVAKEIIWGKLTNAGQTCVAPDYVFVHKNQKHELINLLNRHKTEFSNKININKDYLSRIIDEQHLDNIKKLSPELKYDQNDRYIDLFIKETDVNDAIMQKELFAPILPVIEYQAIKECYDYISKNKWPLSLYIFSEDKNFIQDIINNTNSGTVSINDHLSFLANDKLGFGGIGQSGFGKYHGKTGFDTFTHWKPVTYKKLNTRWNIKYKSLINDSKILRLIKYIMR